MAIITSNTTVTAVFTPVNTDSRQQQEFRSTEVKFPEPRQSSAVADTDQRTGQVNDLALPTTSRVQAPPALPDLDDIRRRQQENAPSVTVDFSEQALRALENAKKEIPEQNRIKDAQLAANLAAATGKKMSEQPINSVMAQANSAPQQAIAVLT